MSDSRPAAEIQTTSTSEHTNSNRVSRDPNTNTDSLIPPSHPCFPSFPSFPAATALGYAIPDGMKRERGLEREQDIPDKMPLCKSRMHGESTRWSAVTVWETRAWTRKKKNGEGYPHILAPRNLLNQSGQPKISCGHSLGQPPHSLSAVRVSGLRTDAEPGRWRRSKSCPGQAFRAGAWWAGEKNPLGPGAAAPHVQRSPCAFPRSLICAPFSFVMTFPFVNNILL